MGMLKKFIQNNGSLGGRLFERIPSEEEDRETEVDAPYHINFYGADFTISVLYQKMRDGEIVLPDFQRGYVWDRRRASRLIESFLLNIPVPGIFVFRESKTQKLLIVDGQQRLKTIEFFLDGKFKTEKEFSLIGVQTKWLKKTYKSLPSADKIRLNDSVLRTIIFEQKDPTDNSTMYQIFERLNTETAPLRDQEIRNALYRGKFNDLLKKLNKNGLWRELIRAREPLPRMRDVEMILRFFALFYNLAGYSKPMKKFLNDFMFEKQNISDLDEQTYAKVFEKTISSIHKGLGVKALRITFGINVAFFDALAVSVAKTTAAPAKILETKAKLLKSDKFIDAIQSHTTDKDKIKRRIEMATRLLS